MPFNIELESKGLFVMRKSALITAVLLVLLAVAGRAELERKGPFATMFWTWQDREIENPEVLLAELHDLKAAGFDGLFAMPRATRYELFDDEMVAAVKLASEACRLEGI